MGYFFPVLTCSSVWPPDKKATPGTAGGTARLRAKTVALAISSGVVAPKVLAFLPGTDMLVFKTMPSR